MSLLEFIRVVALVLIGGLIAWVGDVVGYRLGRKRLSLFGLRPRRTALAIGIVSGILISLVTMGALTLADKQYRQALFGMDALQREMDSLRNETAKRQAELVKSRTEAARAGKEAAAAKQDAATARQSIKTLEAKIADTEARLKGLRGQLADRQARLKAVQAQLAKTQGTNAKLLQAEKTLKQDIARLQQDIQKAQAEKQTLQAQVDKVRQEYTKIEERLLGEYENPAIVEASEELARGIVDLDQPTAGIRDALIGLLDQASEEALARGAATGDNGRAVQLYALREATLAPELQPEVPEPQVLDALVDVLLGQEHKSEALSVVAKFPALAGEPVLVGFRGDWNRLCFTEGEVVASEVLDGSRPRADLYMDLTLLLTGSVRREAEQRRMWHLPNTREYGRMPVHEIFDAIEQLKDYGGPVEVAAVVERDTWTIGPLNIDLRVGEER